MTRKIRYRVLRTFSVVVSAHSEDEALEEAGNLDMNRWTFCRDKVEKWQ
jgi:hypothetical protein